MMTHQEIDAIISECLDQMVGAIQDRLGVTDGAVAAHYFCEGAQQWEALRDILRGYVCTEINFGAVK